MDGKSYSEAGLSMMIDAIHHYIDDATPIRGQLIAKCHQEIGLIVIGAPVQQREAITLSEQEASALRNAVLQWRKAKKRAKKELA